MNHYELPDCFYLPRRFLVYFLPLTFQEFKGTAKEILGTCFAVGCTVDGQKPGALQQARLMEIIVVESFGRS